MTALVSERPHIAFEFHPGERSQIYMVEVPGEFRVFAHGSRRRQSVSQLVTRRPLALLRIQER